MPNDLPLLRWAGRGVAIAVDVITAWITDPDNVDFAIGWAKGYLDEGPYGYQALLAGLSGCRVGC